MAKPTKKRSDMHALVERRDALRALAVAGLSWPLSRRALSADDVASAPPADNDLLVFAYGDREGEVVTADAVQLGAEQILAYPMEPETRVVRNGTRLNQLLVTRVDPSRATQPTLTRSADGIVAYSAVCTHTGCDVTEWNADALRFQCPCHDSQFDPSDGAKVVGGPAPRSLPSLPLKLVNGAVAVAGSFDAPVGFQQPGLDPFGF
jgi:rieske iron-sulfur protein